MSLRRNSAAAFLGWIVAGALVIPAASQEPTIKVESNLVLVDATVKDRGGRPMKELQKDDFLLYENGQQQDIAHFSRDQIPLAVALVVDLSGSIQPFLRPLRYATITALKALKPEDEVALFTFTSEAELRVELTRDKSAVSEQIEFFTAGGGTNINDAVYEAARYLREERPAARRAVVLVSDNVPSGDFRFTHSRVVEEALAADAAVYNIKVPGRNPAGMRIAQKLTQRGQVNVEKLTEETGGEMFDVQRAGSLFLSFQALIDRLKTRYTLGYYPNGPRSGGFRTLEVKLHPTYGRKGSDYSVLAKRGYFAPRT
jgi:Ca-activated chloride channel family protein